MKDWYIEIADCAPEQREIVECVFGKGRKYLNNWLDYRLVSNDREGEKITPDEAFAILGLDKLLEHEPKPLGINWDELADGTATAVIQWQHDLLPINEGFVWVDNTWKQYLKTEQNRIIATRPKPKYTPEQLESVKALAEWIKDSQLNDGKLLDMWLKENGGE